MGLTLEFFVGDVDAITNAIKYADLMRLDDPLVVEKKADFSLHLNPNDLNLLSLEVGIITREDPLLLRPYLSIIIDENDYGLLTVERKWIEYVAQIPSNQSEQLLTNWFTEMAKDYNDPDIIETDQGLKAIRDLVELCNYAIAADCQVVHYWQL
ncbi:MAG: hypothetical protein ABFS17_03715 [Chloroflexota bacterium]